MAQRAYKRSRVVMVVGGQDRRSLLTGLVLSAHKATTVATVHLLLVRRAVVVVVLAVTAETDQAQPAALAERATQRQVLSVAQLRKLRAVAAVAVHLVEQEPLAAVVEAHPGQPILVVEAVATARPDQITQEQAAQASSM